MSDIIETIASAAASEFFARAAAGEGEADIIIDIVRRAILAERKANYEDFCRAEREAEDV